MSIIALVLAGTLALSAPASAQTSSPTQDAYGGVIAEVVTPSTPVTPQEAPQQAQPEQEVAAETATPAPAAPAQPAATQQSALPFTGLQATLVLLAGIALLGGGLVLRRTTRTDS